MCVYFFEIIFLFVFMKNNNSIKASHKENSFRSFIVGNKSQLELIHFQWNQQLLK